MSNSRPTTPSVRLPSAKICSCSRTPWHNHTITSRSHGDVHNQYPELVKAPRLAPHSLRPQVCAACLLFGSISSPPSPSSPIQIFALSCQRQILSPRYPSLSKTSFTMPSPQSNNYPHLQLVQQRLIVRHRFMRPIHPRPFHRGRCRDLCRCSLRQARGISLLSSVFYLISRRRSTSRRRARGGLRKPPLKNAWV